MEKSTVEGRLKDAVKLLYMKDSHLFGVDAKKRSLTFRLGLHHQQLFPEFTVDCEYNRDGKAIKKKDPGEPPTIPDIIIHKRGHDGPNLLAIEAKKKLDSASSYDQVKLLGYKQSQKYAYAVFIVLPASFGGHTIKWM